MELAEQNIGVMTLAALDAVINNRSIEKFHPVHDWIASLPEWDGTCRVEALMTRLTDNDYERRLLVRAFTAMVVQMAGIRQNGYGNSLCPILISTRHGWGKSQFIKRLLPETLRPYFTDSFNPAEEDQCLRRMATRALICLDEFDRFVGKRLTTLKNFIQMSSVDLKQLYQGRYEVKERLASFWGTSNRRYVLMDETGSRRYLGKYLQVEMLPFSLEEFFDWNSLTLHTLAPEEMTNASVLADDYLRNGGYPEVVASRQLVRSYLETLFDAIVWKDVARRHRVRNVSDLNDLAMYLVSNCCNPVSANELTEELGFSSVNTTKKFMDYLHEPYLFYYLPRYNNKLRLMKKAPRKVYVVDNGFVAAKAFALSDNLGRLFENQVFVELVRRGFDTERTLFYYRSRTDKEVDFVLRKGSHIECLVQVCYDMTSAKTEKREVDSLVECAGEPFFWIKIYHVPLRYIIIHCCTPRKRYVPGRMLTKIIWRVC